MHGVYLCQDLRANSQVYKLHIYWKGGGGKKLVHWLNSGRKLVLLHIFNQILLI